jgi:hypothetical protein
MNQNAQSSEIFTDDVKWKSEIYGPVRINRKNRTSEKSAAHLGCTVSFCHSPGNSENVHS